jgi:hypothetical protein
MVAMRITSVAEAIEILGGPTATARMVGRRAQSAVNWRAANRFPANTILILKDELAKRKAEAPSALWGVKEPA